MGPKDHITINQVCKEIGISRVSLLRWEQKGLLDSPDLVRKVRYPKGKLEFRSYTPKGVQFIRWLKHMSGNKGNDFYIKLLSEYILSGKISQKELSWPLK